MREREDILLHVLLDYGIKQFLSSYLHLPQSWVFHIRLSGHMTYQAIKFKFLHKLRWNPEGIDDPYR